MQLGDVIFYVYALGIVPTMLYVAGEEFAEGLGTGSLVASGLIGLLAGFAWPLLSTLWVVGLLGSLLHDLIESRRSPTITRGTFSSASQKD